MSNFFRIYRAKFCQNLTCRQKLLKLVNIADRVIQKIKGGRFLGHGVVLPCNTIQYNKIISNARMDIWRARICCILLCPSVLNNVAIELNGESTSMVWPTLGFRTAKAQKRTEKTMQNIVERLFWVRLVLTVPEYLSRHITTRSSTRSLRSSSAPLLHVPFKRTSFGKRSFSTAAPSVWNSLSVSVQNCDTLTLFKSRLKAHLFSSVYAS